MVAGKTGPYRRRCVLGRTPSLVLTYDEKVDRLMVCFNLGLHRAGGLGRLPQYDDAGGVRPDGEQHLRNH